MEKDIGYSALVERFQIACMPFRHSIVAPVATVSRDIDISYAIKYPTVYLKSDSTIDHLVFALKHEGARLDILKPIFSGLMSDSTQKAALMSFIKNNPKSKYARALWFWCEFLLQEELPLHDTSTGDYINILDADKYFVTGGIRSRRHRIINNLLGNSDFCPIVRKTDSLRDFSKHDFQSNIREATAKYDKDIIDKSIKYLYTKETVDSFAIENETPSPDRFQRFLALLEDMDSTEEITKELLLRVQSAAVGEAKASRGYRENQLYVGSVRKYQNIVHYVCPKPEDVASLMDGLLHLAKNIGGEKQIHPIVQAAAVSFGFVFIHPFDDGNGRTHRYIIHHILSQQGFAPPKMILPVSSTMLNNMGEYDACLEKFSRPLKHLVRYELDDAGRMSISGDTADFYRYMDMTHVAEYLFKTIKQSIQNDFPKELDFMEKYSRAMDGLKRTSELSDRLLGLLLNDIAEFGALSKKKRKKLFADVPDHEIADLEAIARSVFQPAENDGPRGA